MTKSSILERTAWWLIVAAVIAVPLFIGWHGAEVFRLPKDALFLTFGLALAALSIALFTRSIVSRIALAAVAWTTIATAFSANRAISARTLLWVIAAAGFAIALDFAARKRSPLVIALPLIPAAINAVIFLLQRFHISNPMRFPDDVPDHFRFTALIGNPDDVGSFLVAPAIVAVALGVVDRKRRVLWIPAAGLLLVAIATGQLTPMIACGAALLTIGFVRSRRAGVIATTAVIVSAIALATGYAPLRARLAEIRLGIRGGAYANATSGRITPFLAALDMAKDHPLFGVGPGCFGFEYFPYKLKVEKAHPSLAEAYASTFNYGETHNDHLQTLAESGVIGYAILVTALVALARCSRRNADEDERGEITRTIALPLAVGVTVLCLAHFPLHLAAATVVILYVATLCVAWRTATAEPRNPGTAKLIVTAIALLAVVPLAYHFAFQPFVCNERKPAILANTRGAAGMFERYRANELAHANLAELDGCIDANPSDVDFYMLAAANDRVLGRNEDAAAMYRKALTYDRRPEIYYNLGLVELGMNQRASAMSDLLNAARFSRTYLDDLPDQVRAELSAALR